MRLFAATLATETNTFSPLPTSLEAYKESVFFRPGRASRTTRRACARRRCSSPAGAPPRRASR